MRLISWATRKASLLRRKVWVASLFNFEILEGGLPQSALDRTEQFYINAYGGPTTKLFTGELSNARNQMSWLRYMRAGGE